MADTTRTAQDPAGQFFDELARLRAGLLGADRAGASLRPMTHFADREAATIWFLTSRKTDLAEEIGEGAASRFCVMDEEKGIYAVATGMLKPSDDEKKLDELWGPVTGAWFKGRDDPDLMLLRFALHDAELWTSTDSSVQFGLEIARANMDSRHAPDIGAHTQVTF